METSFSHQTNYLLSLQCDSYTCTERGRPENKKQKPEDRGEKLAPCVLCEKAPGGGGWQNNWRFCPPEDSAC